MRLNSDPNWYLETSAMNHMTNMIGEISTYVNNSGPAHIVIGNG